MASAKTREIGRGERVLPGLWRLRLPLPWPGVPHCNAWAIAAGSGVVLIDTGMHLPGSLAHLELALSQCGLRLEHVRLIVCTHAHSDHWGQAAPIAERAGCEFWLHPNHHHAVSSHADPEATLNRRLEVARQSGVPGGGARRLRRAHAGDALRRGGGAGARPRAPPRRRGRDRPRNLVGAGDARPRPVPRLPLPARAPPPASPATTCSAGSRRSTTTAGRRTRSESSSARSSGWTGSTRGSACRATAGRLPTSTPTSRATEHSSPSGSTRCAQHCAGGAPATVVEIVPQVYGEPLSRATGGWWLQETLAYLQPPGGGRGRRRATTTAASGGGRRPANLDTPLSRLVA